MDKSGARSGPKGLDPHQIVDAAITLMEAEGEEGFSIRKLGVRVGCDPMAVLYHFGSREGLERAIVESLAARVTLPDAADPWDRRLVALAMEYRALALRYPNSFPLLLRFWTAGPVDQHLAEYGYACFAEAGHTDDAVADLCLGWYASILGLAAADAGGLLRPSLETVHSVANLDESQFPITTKLRASLEHQRERAVFEGFVERLVAAVKRSF